MAWLDIACSDLAAPLNSACVPVAAMHDLDPTFMQWSRSAQVVELLQDLGYKKPTPVQSMYIFKVSRPCLNCCEFDMHASYAPVLGVYILLMSLLPFRDGVNALKHEVCMLMHCYTCACVELSFLICCAATQHWW